MAKLHLEVALLSSASWSSFQQARDATASFLHDHYDAIKHNPGALLYCNPRLAAAGPAAPTPIDANVAHIRICELQHSSDPAQHPWLAADQSPIVRLDGVVLVLHIYHAAAPQPAHRPALPPTCNATDVPREPPKKLRRYSSPSGSSTADAPPLVGATPSSLEAELMALDENIATAAKITPLPSAELDGSWDQLIFDGAVKSRLIQYAETIHLFASKHVSPHIVAWHGLILLCGPPGTGKTSLLKAFAQKLAVRWMAGGRGLSAPLASPYAACALVEIRCGALFSKWFGESARQVAALMAALHGAILAHPARLICVLIDEVESLTMSRAGAVAGTEPSDYLRVVNTILTHLDMLKSLPNVLIFCTSNLESTLDEAFRDRIDFIVHLTYPTASTVCSILTSTIDELLRAGLVVGGDQESDCDSEDDKDDTTLSELPSVQAAQALLQTALYAPRIFALAQKCCSGGTAPQPVRPVTGRHLRRLALLAFARTRHYGPATRHDQCTLDQLLHALEAEIVSLVSAP